MIRHHCALQVSTLLSFISSSLEIIMLWWHIKNHILCLHYSGVNICSGRRLCSRQRSGKLFSVFCVTILFFFMVSKFFCTTASTSANASTLTSYSSIFIWNISTSGEPTSSLIILLACYVHLWTVHTHALFNNF